MSEENQEIQEQEKSSTKKGKKGFFNWMRNHKLAVAGFTAVGLLYLGDKVSLSRTFEDAVDQGADVLTSTLGSFGKGFHDFWYTNPSGIYDDLKRSFENYHDDVVAGQYDDSIAKLKALIDTQTNPEAKKQFTMSDLKSVMEAYRSSMPPEKLDEMVKEVANIADEYASDNLKAQQKMNSAFEAIKYFNEKGLVDLLNEVNGQMNPESMYQKNLEIMTKSTEQNRYSAIIGLMASLPGEQRVKITEEMVLNNTLPKDAGAAVFYVFVQKDPNFVYHLSNYFQQRKMNEQAMAPQQSQNKID